MTKYQISKIDRLTLHGKLILKAFSYSLTSTGNFIAAVKVVTKLIKRKVDQHDFGPQSRLCVVNGKCYWNLNLPGFPSKAFDHTFQKLIDHELGITGSSELMTGIVAITKKCSLNCEHCFESETLNQKEGLSEQEIIDIIEKLIDIKAGQIIFSGGDPVNRFETLIRVLEHFKNSHTDFWINTSGYNLTEERITRLSRAGLTGIIFSLDHHSEAEHDKFRGLTGSYQSVILSVSAAKSQGLVTALSLCATNEFISMENMARYLELAKQFDVNFIQILEPKSLGRYAHGMASLTAEKRQVLEDLYNEYYQETKRFDGYPILTYPDYTKRKHGCYGGNRYLYIDSDGKLYPCPFCKSNAIQVKALDRLPANLQLACPAK